MWLGEKLSFKARQSKPERVEHGGRSETVSDGEAEPNGETDPDGETEPDRKTDPDGETEPDRKTKPRGRP